VEIVDVALGSRYGVADDDLFVGSRERVGDADRSRQGNANQVRSEGEAGEWEGDVLVDLFLTASSRLAAVCGAMPYT